MIPHVPPHQGDRIRKCGVGVGLPRRAPDAGHARLEQQMGGQRDDRVEGLNTAGVVRAMARAFPWRCVSIPGAPVLPHTSLPWSSAGQTRSGLALAYAPDSSTARPAACRLPGVLESAPNGWRQAAYRRDTTRPWRWQFHLARAGAIPRLNGQLAPRCFRIGHHGRSVTVLS